MKVTIITGKRVVYECDACVCIQYVYVYGVCVFSSNEWATTQDEENIGESEYGESTERSRNKVQGSGHR